MVKIWNKNLILAKKIIKIAKKSIAAEALEAVESFSRQALHACVLGFVHPRSGKKLRFEVAPADDMASLMQLLEQKSTWVYLKLFKIFLLFNLKIV